MNTIDHERLQETINASGYNYTMIAERSNISRNTIYNIMYGVTDPSHYVMNSLALTLELAGEEFIAIFFPDLRMEKTQ